MQKCCSLLALTVFYIFTICFTHALLDLGYNPQLSCFLNPFEKGCYKANTVSSLHLIKEQLKKRKNPNI